MNEIAPSTIRIRLIEDGYTGLYFPGECACGLEDLAPCGNASSTDGERYINGCLGGYKHQDPARPHFFIVNSSPEEPSPDVFSQTWSEI